MLPKRWLSWLLVALIDMVMPLNALAEENVQSTQTVAAGAADKDDQQQIQALPEVNVSSEAEIESAYGPVEGYVANRGATATKTDTPLIEMPQSISVITRDRLDDENPSNIGEALRYVPGVTTQPFGFDSRFDFFNIRGFSGTTNGSLYRDGLQLRSQGFRQFRYDIYGLERIEVLRGPASVLFGQGTIGGVVNYITKRPTREPLREFILEAGNFDRFQGKFDLSGPVADTDTLSYRLTGLARDSKTQVDFVEDDRIFIAPSLTWQPSEDTSLTILSHFEEDSTGSSNNFFPFAGTVRGNPNGRIPVHRFSGEPTFDQYDRKEYSLGYLFEHKASDTWTFRQNARFDHTDVDFKQAFGLGLDPADSTQRLLQRGAFVGAEESDAFAIDTQAQAKVVTGSIAHTLLFGIDYQRSEFDVVSAFGLAPSIDLYTPVYGVPVTDPAVVAKNDGVQYQTGLYFQEQAKFLDKWVLTLGGRQDYVDSETTDRLANTRTDENDHKFSGRAGLVYLADNGLAPYISYSESFLPVAGVDLSGRRFDPETGEQYEVGVKYQPPGVNAFITVAAFDLRRQNVSTPDPINPANTLQTGEVRSRGIELEAVASLDTNLDVIATYTFQDLEITKSNDGTEGNTPSAVPRHLVSLRTNYSLREGWLAGLNLGLGLRYVGTTFVDDANSFKTESYTLVDASAQYDWKKFSVGLNVNNLFDKEYIAGCSGAACFYGATRTVVGSLRYRF
jgi:iron complex outermembrane receptor protein